MKKAYIIKDYNSVWGVQNRVEALVDLSMNKANVPYDIDINGDDVLITVDDNKRSAYESDFEYNSDIQLFDRFMKDIQDPLFAEDVNIVSYNENTSTPDTIEDFKKVALESCSSLGVDILRGFGLDLPEVKEDVEESMSPLSRAQAASALADQLDKENGLESLDFTVDKIPQYNSETDRFEDDDESSIVTPAEAVAEASGDTNDDSIKDSSDNDTVEDTKIPDSAPEVVKLIKSDEPDANSEFINEFVNALKEFDMTPKTFVAAVMAIKALANNSAKAKDEEPEISPEDVTGEEDYSYTNAVPYVQNPNEKAEPEIETQSMNVPEGKPNSEIGTESMSADDVYSSLVNESIDDIGVENIPVVEEFTEAGMEAFWSKKPISKGSADIIEEQMNVCEDAKPIVAKAFKSLKEKNEAIFTKYGAFMKLLLDVEDVKIMDKRFVKMNIAKFDLKKANKEVVPDTTTEAVIHSVTGAVVGSITSSILGPFAKLAMSTDNTPSNYLLAIANQLKSAIESEIKPAIKKYDGIITLSQDELDGSAILLLGFKPIYMSNESVEPEEIPLIKQLAMESSTDDEFFDKVMDNFDNLDRLDVKETTKFNMWHFYRTGEKIPCDSAVTGKRLCEFIKK